MTEPEAPQEPQNGERAKSKFSSFLSHPGVAVVTFVSAIVGLIGLPLSFYFYYASKEYPRLTYYAHPVKATIVRAGEASRLSASFDNRPVETDITAAQVAIWNQGTRPIRREQVLRPVVIYTENSTPILEATIRKSSREVTQLSLDTAELQKGRVTVLWDILEQRDGGVIQLIYAGNSDVQVKAEGVVEGQPQLERLEFTGKIKSPHEQYESERLGYKGWGIVLLWLGLGLLAWAWALRTTKAINARENSELLKIYEDSKLTREKWIEWEAAQIDTYEGYIAVLEERAKEAKQKGFDDLVQMNDNWIAEYRRDQEECRERIKKYEKEREDQIIKIAEQKRAGRTKERKLKITSLGLLVLALIVLATAIFILFVAQPAGPPFDF